MSPTKILITGANVGLGKDAARQLALKDGVTKVILACRNEEKAKAAKEDLEKTTGKDVFEILIMDTSDIESVKKAVSELKEPIDGLIMNAGGGGGPNPGELAKDGVMAIVAVNWMGHVVLVDTLLAQKKLVGSAIYSGSEVTRGVPSIGFKRPDLKEGSVDEFTKWCDGSAFKQPVEFDTAYGPTKLMATLWMSYMARSNSDVRFVTVSPGMTSGTAVTSDLPFLKKTLFKMMFPVMQLFGTAHGLETGAKRYVDVLCDDGTTYKAGHFYASEKGVSGKVVDQSVHWDAYGNETYQNNANEAIHKFIK